MTSRYWILGIRDTPPTSRSLPSICGAISHQRAPTDPWFSADIEVINLLVDSAYLLKYEGDDTTIQTGTSATTSFTSTDVSAVTLPEIISLMCRKYGKKEYEVLNPHNSLGLIMYVAQIDDPNIAESDPAVVAAYVGYSANFTTKKLTAGANPTRAKIYDYANYSASLFANLTGNYPISTVVGTNYSLATGWTLILEDEISGGINLTGDVELSGVFDLDGHNITGSLTITTAGTYNLTDCVVTEVINTSGGAVIINALGSTNITTNTGPNITINQTISITVTVVDDTTGLPVEDAGVLIRRSDNNAVILKNTTNSLGVVTETINYTGDIGFEGWARQHDLSGIDYIAKDFVGTITNSDMNLTIKLIQN